MNSTSRAVRWGLSLVGAVVIYLNCSVIWHPLAARLQQPALPVVPKLSSLFLLFGVFSGYETNNHELMLWGYTGDSSVGKRGWQPLAPQDYFPFIREERNRRLWATKYFRGNDSNHLWQAWSRYGDQILVRHNRLHPNVPVSQVGIESRIWPRSQQGFYTLMKPANLESNFWVVATNRGSR